MCGVGDLLVLEGMSFYGYHGETSAERELGNHFRVDLEMRMDLAPAGRSDRIADTLDYAQAFSLVREVVEERAFNLLESLAENIATCILAEPRVSSVRVRVSKPPPIRGAIERCSVIIERGREGAP